MIVGTRGSVVRLLLWQWRGIALSALLATVVAVANLGLGQTWVSLPALPLAIAGAALGIFVSFRTNSAYDRWWEGRKLWGRLINTSRHFAVQTRRYFPTGRDADAKKLVRRHIGYVHTLRCLLRDQDPFDDDDASGYLAAEEPGLQGSSNLTARLLDLQLRDLERFNRAEVVDNFRLQMFDTTIRELFDIQGACERIKKTPLPRPYSFISERMIQWFGAMIPAALVADLGWFTIPVSVLVVLGFKLISETGRVLEEPFTTFFNGLPLFAMSRTIEINLLELHGEENLPAPATEQPPGILM